MVCRHAAGDPNCGSNQYRYSPPEPTTPDKKKYNIVDVERVGSHVVLKVLYPNCSKCSYEGNKVMVFLDVLEKDILKWREIDPHFRGPTKIATEAPSPAARFPASPEGWIDAITYARGKVK